MRDRLNGRPVRVAKRRLPALALGLGLAALPLEARAQMFGFWNGWDNAGTEDGLSQRQIRHSIAQQGFRVVSPLRRNGSVFVAEVLDRRGRRERLIVAAADAQILQRFYVDDAHPSDAPARTAEEQPGLVSRFFGGVDGGLVPPASIPTLGRRPAAPTEATPQRRFGDLDDGGDAAAVPPLPLRPQPPIRTVRPRPRVVERTPDTAEPQRQPAAVVSTPLAPAPRPRAAEPARGAAAPPKVASRPDLPAPAGSPAAAPPPPSRRPSDPLAIPGGSPKAESPAPQVRSVSGAVTGAPQAPPVVMSPTPPRQSVAPAKSSDVPVAPLD